MANDEQHTDNGPNDGPIAHTPPAIVAAFEVRFDERKGYILAWQRSVSGLNLDGIVEFKSMPSGLHNVKQDLVYFVYEDYAGVSAVLNVPDEGAARKVKVIAVGVLVPLEHGRMGKSWLHAESLKALAEEQTKRGDEYSLLEEYWEEHKVTDSPDPEISNGCARKDDMGLTMGPNTTSVGYRATRSMSVATVSAMSSIVLPIHHPALALPDFLHLFGPLIFPLVRAALLRKRILFLGEAPVEKTCNFVYNLSILSSLPKPIVTLLPSVSPSTIRSRPLFNVGVSDIGTLESESESDVKSGWIACTTDDVICTKPKLFDVLVVLPSAITGNSGSRPYPKMFFSGPELSKARPKHSLRASQRDAKRFANISRGLQLIPRARRKSMHGGNSFAVASPADTTTDLQTTLDTTDRDSIISTASSTISQRDIVEPQSWSRIAYTSLVWWASAGDKRSGLTEIEEVEDEQDVALLTGRDLDEDNDSDRETRSREVACVQYFHRLTNMIFTAMNDAVRRQDRTQNGYTDDDDEESEHDEPNEAENNEDDSALLQNKRKASKVDKDDAVEITQEDMQSMGLDVWSESDRHFVEEWMQCWWGRKADVQSGRIECCGIRLM